MGNSYTRQSAANIVTGAIVQATPINAEFNQLQNAFDSAAGHAHDGTLGNGPKINLTASISGVLPIVNGGIGGINKTNAVVPPTVTNDVNSGYVTGSLWVNIANNTVYICTDPTIGAAIWKTYQIYDNGLQSISNLTTAADTMIYTTALDVYATTALTPFSRTVLATVDAATHLTSLGVSAFIQTLFPAANAAAARTTLGLTIGTNVQAWGSKLDTLSAYNTNGLFTQTASGTYTGRTVTGTANEITLVNGDGVSGNPVVSLPSALTFTGKTVTSGTYSSPTINTPTISTPAITNGTINGSVPTNIPSLNGGPLNTNRSKIINGNFDIWQRGLSQTANGYGCADRWYYGCAGSTQAVSQQAFTVGQTVVPGNPKFFSRVVVTSVVGATNNVVMLQPITQVDTFSGKTVTAVFWAKADANKNMSFELYQQFGTGGSPSAVVTAIGAQKVALTTSWQKFALVIAVPSIAGKTLGTNGDHNLIPTFWFDAGSSFNTRSANLGQQSGTFDIARVDLIEGDASLEPDPHANETFQETLAKCLPYFEKSYDYGVYPGGTTGGGYEAGVAINAGDFYTVGLTKFKVRKRTTPNVAVYAPTSGTSGVFWNASVGGNQGNQGPANASEIGFWNRCSNNALTTNQIFAWHWIADAELLP